MSLREYLKERWLQFTPAAGADRPPFWGAGHDPRVYLLLVGCAFVSIWFVVWCTDYEKAQFLQTVENHLAHLDQKYLLPELLESQVFWRKILV